MGKAIREGDGASSSVQWWILGPPGERVGGSCQVSDITDMYTCTFGDKSLLEKLLFCKCNNTEVYTIVHQQCVEKRTPTHG